MYISYILFHIPVYNILLRSLICICVVSGPARLGEALISTDQIQGNDKPGGCYHHPLPTAPESFSYMGERKRIGLTFSENGGFVRLISECKGVSILMHSPSGKEGKPAQRAELGTEYAADARCHLVG